jgi:hypothetical protein
MGATYTVRDPIEYSWLTAHHVGVPVIIPTELTKGQGSVAESVSIHQPHHTPAIQLEAVAITVRSDAGHFIIYITNYLFKTCHILLRMFCKLVGERENRQNSSVCLLKFNKKKVKYVTAFTFHSLLELCSIITLQ